MPRPDRPDYDPSAWRNNPTYALAKMRQVEDGSDKELYPELVIALLETYRHGESVLDVGCCGGHFYSQLLRHTDSIDYTGVDVTPEYIEFARERFPGVPFHIADARKLPFADGSFDYVLCLFVLLHLGEEGVAQAVQELTRVARKQVVLAGYFAEKRYEGIEVNTAGRFIYDVIGFDELIVDGWLLETSEEDGEDRTEHKMKVGTDFQGLDGSVCTMTKEIPVVPYIRLVNAKTKVILENREKEVSPYAMLVKKCQE